MMNFKTSFINPDDMLKIKKIRRTYLRLVSLIEYRLDVFIDGALTFRAGDASAGRENDYQLIAGGKHTVTIYPSGVYGFPLKSVNIYCRDANSLVIYGEEPEIKLMLLNDETRLDRTCGKTRFAEFPKANISAYKKDSSYSPMTARTVYFKNNAEFITLLDGCSFA